MLDTTCVIRTCYSALHGLLQQCLFVLIFAICGYQGNGSCPKVYVVTESKRFLDKSLHWKHTLCVSLQDRQKKPQAAAVGCRRSAHPAVLKYGNPGIGQTYLHTSISGSRIFWTDEHASRPSIRMGTDAALSVCLSGSIGTLEWGARRLSTLWNSVRPLHGSQLVGFWRRGDPLRGPT